MVKLKQYLQSIFDYYNLKYKLNYKLIFEPCFYKGSNRHTCCYYLTKTIHIDFSQLQNKHNMYAIIKRLQSKTKLSYYLGVLLHEIKHAIDYNTTIWECEHGLDTIDHANRPNEKRADNWAIDEAKKWV